MDIDREHACVLGALGSFGSPRESQSLLGFLLCWPLEAPAGPGASSGASTVREGPMTNELFRMVGLRHSKPSTRERPPDPRLQYGEILAAQATIEPSPREITLQKLKDHYNELANKAAQLEIVQRAILNAYMLDWQYQPIPNPGPPRRDVKARSATSRAVAVLDAGSPTHFHDFNFNHFSELVKLRLNEVETGLFGLHPVWMTPV
jgi:hypothetical protein